MALILASQSPRRKELLALICKDFTVRVADIDETMDPRAEAAAEVARVSALKAGAVPRGAGDTVTPMWISLITTIGMRVPLAYGISYLTRTPSMPIGAKECIQISLVASWVMGAIITAIFYARGKWKDKAIK